MTYANKLEALIYDCGGPERIAEATGLAKTSIWGWIDRGHVPLSDLTGRTSYSEVLAGMQRSGRLSTREIKLIGLTL